MPVTFVEHGFRIVTRRENAPWNQGFSSGLNIALTWIESSYPPERTEAPLVDVTRSAILIVDDNPHNLSAFEASLDGIAADVVRASSGQQALRCLLEREFAVVVLDVKMPDLDGFETAKIIRARSRTQHTPIIFATAYSRDDTQVLEAYKMGAVDFLFKPITSEVLRAKVSVFIELRRRAEELRLQAEQLREHQRREHERVLEEEKRRWDEAAMRKRLEELAQADQRKDEFLAMLGHELRNPLAPIVTGLRLIQGPLLANVNADGTEARAFATVDRQVRHLRRLVDDLLDISRINCGKIQIETEPISLNAIIEQAIVTAKPALDERGHILKVDLAPEPLTLMADPVRMIQIVSNLLHNAARYTNPGGQISLSSSHSAGEASVTVRDNGTGIDPALMPTIFDIFVQRRPNANGGLGLGLTLVRRLVELHGGTVTAQSEGIDRGSSFTVTLPLVERSRSTDAPSARSPMATPPPSLSTSPQRGFVLWWWTTTSTFVKRSAISLSRGATTFGPRAMVKKASKSFVTTCPASPSLMWACPASMAMKWPERFANVWAQSQSSWQ